MHGVRGILYIMLLLSTAECLAQVDTAWVRRYDGSHFDQANALAVDGSGNVYVTGYSAQSFISPYNYDYATIKYAPNGDTFWVRRYNGPGDSHDSATALAVDGSGNVYVTGHSWSGTSYDYATIKYAANGDTLWVRGYNGPGNTFDKARALAVDGSGNVYVTGHSWSGTSYDYATIKYAPNGDTFWIRRYNGPGILTSDDWATALAVDDSGNVYVTGHSWSGTSSDDYTTVKYAPNGDSLWVRRYNGPGNGFDQAYALAVDGGGNVYVTGRSGQTPTYNFNFDYATIKYAPNGDTLWVRRYNGPGDSHDSAAALAVDGSGNVYVTGYSWGSGTYHDYATVKYAPNGDTLWVRRYNGSGNGYDQATALAVDDSGNVYVTGWGTESGTNNDYTTIKYAPNGDTLWVTRYNGPGRARALAVDSGNVYVTGSSNSDYATIKYVHPPMIIRAYSPVDLIVNDPNNDSIGVSFNTISGASYSVSNDSIHIPKALTGNYEIKVKLDTLDLSGDTSYTLTVQIGGASAQVLVSDQHVPDTGETQTITITSNPSNPDCFAKPGDANASGTYTLADVIAIVNYVFNKAGCAPQPLCWLTNSECRGDWNGSNSVTLSDVIQAVNFVFNKPGGPWDALSSGACCLP